MTKSVLIVDDEQQYLDELKVYFESLKWDITQAKNVEMAKELLNSLYFDILVTDNDMPLNSRMPVQKNQGIELLRYLITGTNYGHIKKIMYSGSPYGLSCAEGLKIPTVHKNVEDLESKLNEILEIKPKKKGIFSKILSYTK